MAVEMGLVAHATADYRDRPRHVTKLVFASKWQPPSRNLIPVHTDHPVRSRTPGAWIPTSPPWGRSANRVVLQTASTVRWSRGEPSLQPRRAGSVESSTRQPVTVVPCARGEKGEWTRRREEGSNLCLCLTHARDIGDNSATLRSVSAFPPEQLSPLSLVRARGRGTMRTLDCPAGRGARPLTALPPYRQPRRSSGEPPHGERLRSSPSRQTFRAQLG